MVIVLQIYDFCFIRPKVFVFFLLMCGKKGKGFKRRCCLSNPPKVYVLFCVVVIYTRCAMRSSRSPSSISTTGISIIV